MVSTEKPVRTVAGAGPETKTWLAPFLVYLVFFYAVWTFVWVRGLYPWATRTIGDSTLLYALISIGVRFSIWLLPVGLYLRLIDHVEVLAYLRLRQDWKRGVVIGLVLSILNFLGTMARLGPPAWSNAHVTWNSILGTSILVGVFEEVPFRGFILQKLQKRYGFGIAAVTSSALFVGAHVPGWIALGTLTVFNVAFIFAFGLIMALIFTFSRSLWAPILVHSLNDGLSNVLFRM